ncbi:MAG: bacteriohemerythrin [Alphaproteobacteria bacterium]
MTGIQWLPSFETGIDEIDDDHRALVDTIGKIQKGCDEGDMGVCQTYFDKFLSQARDHFEREEAFLKSIDFPSVEAHAASHRNLLKLVEKTLKTAKNETDVSVLKTQMEDMTYYLLEDVIKADAEFKSYAREHNLR